MIGLTEFMHKV